MSKSGELKLKVMKEIAKEYQVEWVTTDSEAELLKPLEQRLIKSFICCTNLSDTFDEPIGLTDDLADEFCLSSEAPYFSLLNT